MAEFLPFAGLHYDPAKVNLADVLCPPYDVIKGTMRDELIAQSPHNIVVVELPEATASGSSVQGGEAEKYEAAATILAAWRAEGILVQDAPAFYVYEQEFAVPGSGEIKKRRGVLGALRLEEFGATVKPHEHTLSGPKEDRLKLLRATHTNTSPIFSLYDDSSGWVERILEPVCNAKPLLEARDENDIVHRLWRLTDDESVNAIVAALRDEPIFIADGHHRYETALNFRNERRKAVEEAGGNWTGEELENWVMMMCVSTSDDGLVVLPTHRIAKGLSGEAVSNAVVALEEHFDVELIATESSPEVQAQELMARVNAESDRPRLGVHIAGQSYLLTLREGDSHLAAMNGERSQAYNELDVSILHTLIMERLLGIDAAALAAGGHVLYTIHAHEAIGKVNRGEGQVAFLLRPTLVSQVQNVAAAGDKMPQKSTYFYPKLITGLVLRPVTH
jgi:uncharacterized protein (DUF1015 family)